ncbi:hypothetical protein, partial [Sorangium cellulosum]|uniref:hypothetical protein n=1 Tax=Sorangium cellulosum TaxID=56 RepID=UPI0012DB78F2
MLEVLRQHEGVALAGLLQPCAGEPVAEPSIDVGQHAVGRLAHEPVTEGELLLAGEPWFGTPHDPFASLQRREPRAE